MDFMKATNELMTGVTLTDLAQALGVSVQAVRQARATPGSAANRPPPHGWEKATAKLARRRAKRLAELARKLQT